MFSGSEEALSDVEILDDDVLEEKWIRVTGDGIFKATGIFWNLLKYYQHYEQYII